MISQESVSYEMLITPSTLRPEVIGYGVPSAPKCFSSSANIYKKLFAIAHNNSVNVIRLFFGSIRIADRILMYGGYAACSWALP